MATKKKSNSHNSTAKKRSASKRSALSTRSKLAKKTAAKRSPAGTKSKKSKQARMFPNMSKELEEITLKMFQMTYEAYQKGKLHPIFHDYPH